MKNLLGVTEMFKIRFWYWLYNSINLLKLINCTFKIGEFIICILYFNKAVKQKKKKALPKN